MNTIDTRVVVALVGFLGVAGPAQAAVNDSFDSATPIAGLSAQVAGNNNSCGVETGEPEHYPECPAASSVWWRWTAPTAGHVTIHTLGSDFDTVLAVYTGATLGALAQVVCNDDRGAETASWVDFVAEAGAEYQIAVDGVGGAQGSIRLTVRSDAVLAPSNATFESRTVVSGLTVDWVGSNSNAMAQDEAPLLAGRAAVAPVWWSWTAPTSCVMEADTRGSGIDTVLGVYTGNVLNALIEQACNDDRGGDSAARLWWAVQAGTTYQIAVDGAGGAWGPIHLSLREVKQPIIGGVGVGSVRWGSLAGENYRVLRSTNLFDWASVTSLVAEAAETVVTFADASDPHVFYRIGRYLP